jgi:hypothetical protein
MSLFDKSFFQGFFRDMAGVRRPKKAPRPGPMRKWEFMYPTLLSNGRAKIQRTVINAPTKSEARALLKKALKVKHLDPSTFSSLVA